MREKAERKHLAIPHAHQRLCKVMPSQHLLSKGGTRGEGKWDGCVGGSYTLEGGALTALLADWSGLALEDSVFPPVNEIIEVSSLHELGRSTVRVAEVAQRDIIHVRRRPKLADNACK